MISAKTNMHGAALSFEATVDGLAIYLDNWAIIELAKGDPSRRERFLGALRASGDLLFSATNAAELRGPKGNSLDAVRSFLDGIGPRWVPVELNPFKIVERERCGIPHPQACVSPEFIKAYFTNRTVGFVPGSGKIIDLSEDFFRLGPLLDWVAQSEQIAARSAEFDALLQTIRSYAKNPSLPDPSAVPFNPRQPATFASFHLMRTLISEAKSHQIKKGDGLDFCHAVVASAYASVAALDKHWKRRVENLPRPNGLAPIYYQQELNKMVDDIENWISGRPAGVPR